jgi:hypothetical protein
VSATKTRRRVEQLSRDEWEERMLKRENRVIRRFEAYEAKMMPSRTFFIEALWFDLAELERIAPDGKRPHGLKRPHDAKMYDHLTRKVVEWRQGLEWHRQRDGADDAR